MVCCGSACAEEATGDDRDEAAAPAAAAAATSLPAFQVLGRNSGRRVTFFLLASLKPAAMTVILTESFICSSCTAPKMMLAFSCAAFWMMDEASCTSCSVKLGLPQMLMRMPCA